MIFYGKGYVWDGSKVVPFVDGKLEIKDPDLIKRLKKKYRSEEDGEAVKGNPEGQAVKKEQTFAELRQEAKAREIEGYGKMTKLELIEALKEGE